jgi:hypothetical protein
VLVKQIPIFYKVSKFIIEIKSHAQLKFESGGRAALVLARPRLTSGVLEETLALQLRVLEFARVARAIGPRVLAHALELPVHKLALVLAARGMEIEAAGAAQSIAAPRARVDHAVGAREHALAVPHQRATRAAHLVLALVDVAVGEYELARALRLLSRRRVQTFVLAHVCVYLSSIFENSKTSRF